MISHENMMKVYGWGLAGLHATYTVVYNHPWLSGGVAVVGGNYIPSPFESDGTSLTADAIDSVTPLVVEPATDAAGQAAVKVISSAVRGIGKGVAKQLQKTAEEYGIESPEHALQQINAMAQPDDDYTSLIGNITGTINEIVTETFQSLRSVVPDRDGMTLRGTATVLTPLLLGAAAVDQFRRASHVGWDTRKGHEHLTYGILAVAGAVTSSIYFE